MAKRKGLRSTGQWVLAAVAGMLAAAPAANGQSGGFCELAGTARYDTEITFVPTDYRYEFEATLDGCRWNGTEGPDGGTLQVGGIYTAGGVDVRLPDGEGNGGCGTSTSAATSVIDWNDGSRTIVRYQTATVTGAGVLDGDVVEDLEVEPIGGGDPIRLSTTRGANHRATGAFGFEADPTDCVTGGTEAGIRGLTALFGD